MPIRRAPSVSMHGTTCAAEQLHLAGAPYLSHRLVAYTGTTLYQLLGNGDAQHCDPVAPPPGSSLFTLGDSLSDDDYAVIEDMTE